jgi:hypothetical protein
MVRPNTKNRFSHNVDNIMDAQKAFFATEIVFSKRNISAPAAG